MSNPCQSPQAPLEPGEPPGMTVATIRAFLGGFLTCGLVAYLAPLAIVLLLLLPGSELLSPHGRLARMIFLISFSPSEDSPPSPARISRLPRSPR